MRPVSTGVQWTSRVSPRTRITIAAVLAALTLAIPSTVDPTPAAAANGYILMSRSALMARPVTGARWQNLRSVASSSLGSPNLCDQNSKHHLRTLAAALVYARTGSAAYGTKARNGVMAAIRTQRVGCNNAALALGRQLMGYVLAADFANLSGSNDSTFRSWLRTIRRKVIGGHGVWNSLFRTHYLSATNWGAYAGASRIAASLYLGDRTDVLAASRVTRGFLGYRPAHAFSDNMSSAALSWSCTPTRYVPVNGYCRRGGMLVDGVVIADLSRGGSRQWPPGDDRDPVPAGVDPGPRHAGRAALPERLPLGMDVVQPGAPAHGQRRDPLAAGRWYRLERDAGIAPDAVAARPPAAHVDPAGPVRHGPGHRVHRLAVGLTPPRPASSASA